MKGGQGGKGVHSIHKQSVIETEVVDDDEIQNSYLSIFKWHTFSFGFMYTFHASKLYFVH